MDKKFRVGILWATWMVGQRFISLLEWHPWFDIVLVAASPNSANKTYEDAVSKKWSMKTSIPNNIRNLNVFAVEEDLQKIVPQVDFVFCALDLDKNKIKEIENLYAQNWIPVVSNNSAHRWTKDVPMIMPELNHDHLDIIPIQQKNYWWDGGFIVVKSNCSIQSYIPALDPLLRFWIEKVFVTTYQAISWSWKTFNTWPEMIDNVIPFIWWEEEKSEKEPLKVWWKIEWNEIINEDKIIFSTTCIRVPVTDGHMASVSVKFKNKPSKEEILEIWRNFKWFPQENNLPFAPKQFLKYFEEDDRPQTKLERDLENGMWVSIWRLRECNVLDYKFVCLSHNTIRGAAWWAILVAETLVEKGYIR